MARRRNVQTVQVELGGGLNFADPVTRLSRGELAIARNCMYFPESNKLAKVPGRRLFGSVGGAITGLCFVQFRSAGAFLIVASGFQYLTTPLAGGGAGIFTARATLPLAVGRIEAVYFNGADRVFISDGENRPQVWDGVGAMRNMSLEIPDDGTYEYLTPSDGSTDYVTGTTFQTCHTEYDADNDIESPPCNVQVASAEQNPNSTFKYTVPGIKNTGVTNLKFRFYRSQNGGQIMYRVAEADAIRTKYYDGTLSDGGDPATSWTNDDQWGFDSVNDLFLTTQPPVDMVGEPLRANYVSVNGMPPIGSVALAFKNKHVITAIQDYPQDVHHSMADWPEQFTQVDYVREENAIGDQVVGAGIANDRLIVFTLNTIWRHNILPSPSVDPGFILGEARRENTTEDHGCVAKRSIVNFGLGQPNNRLFYVSTRGPMWTDGYTTFPLNEDLDWDRRFLNFGAMSNAVSANFAKYAQVWLFVPSKDSNENDIAWIYHYHPNHVKKNGVGKWTGPVHVRCADAAVVYEQNTETRLFTADTNASGNVYQEDSGIIDDSHYQNAAGDIHWEWMSGDHDFGAESVLKKVHRCFINVVGVSSFSPSFKVAVNQADRERTIHLVNQTDNSRGLVTLGTSQVEDRKTRTYRGVQLQTGTHFRYHMSELGQAAREIASVELEVQGLGRQR